jgi:hypothetical protein
MAMSDQNRVKQPAERKFHIVKQGRNRAKSGPCIGAGTPFVLTDSLYCSSLDSLYGFTGVLYVWSQYYIYWTAHSLLSLSSQRQ